MMINMALSSMLTGRYRLALQTYFAAGCITALASHGSDNNEDRYTTSRKLRRVTRSRTGARWTKEVVYGGVASGVHCAGELPRLRDHRHRHSPRRQVRAGGQAFETHGSNARSRLYASEKEPACGSPVRKLSGAGGIQDGQRHKTRTRGGGVARVPRTSVQRKTGGAASRQRQGTERHPARGNHRGGYPDPVTVLAFREHRTIVNQEREGRRVAGGWK